MREFMQRYSSVWSTTRETMDKLCAQFDEDLTKMTTMKLLEMFVAERGTGSTQPRIVPFEDAEVAAVFSPSVEHSTPGGAVAVRALGMFNIDQRASSALASM
ncbi:Optic atrophy 1 protein opa1 [Fasciola gigantica]|uniref:Optic atrophy 1 protein opa1 n=1 Tax=Fasciola gigantica TaxID=46835 RepID=A0A504YLN9_FASGI|nr:Optic atrophy 1 protein opa1 [Fasciola gigantica]